MPIAGPWNSIPATATPPGNWNVSRHAPDGAAVGSTATLFEMNEQELRAYALRGLKTRLSELDDERARILALLEQWDDAAKPSIRRKIRSVPDPSEPVDVAETLVATRPMSSSLPLAVEPEVARILPRRNRAQARPPAAEAPPALPPMPRLVKFRAS